MKILVTGSSGYLGSVLCEVLLKAGHEILAVDSKPPVTVTEPLVTVTSDCHGDSHQAFHRGDIRDRNFLKPLIKQADILIPLAAIVGAPSCAKDSKLAHEVNLEGIRLLHELRSEDQLVVYPNTNNGYQLKKGESFCAEDSPFKPASVYAETKWMAEQLLLEYPNTISFRLASLFGVSSQMRRDLLLHHFVYLAWTQRKIDLFEKDFRRSFVHVQDVAECFLHGIKNHERMRGKVYNVALDSGNLTKKELADQIKARIPELEVNEVSSAKDPEHRDFFISSERLRKSGFEASRSISQGIDEILNYYKTKGPKPGSIRT